MVARQPSLPPFPKIVRECRRIYRRIAGVFDARSAPKLRPAPAAKRKPPGTLPGSQPVRKPERHSDAPSLRSDLDFGPLRERYRTSQLAAEPDTFCLWRIIGNDLPPRHRVGQSRSNVAFILEHEPELRDCTKHWILNRIQDADELAAIVDLLERHNQSYHRIDFDLDAYGQQPWDFDWLQEPSVRGTLKELESKAGKTLSLQARIRRKKNNYAINNNSVRNLALTLGRPLAKWVLPWDGNCFLTAAAWEGVRNAVVTQPFVPYFLVPMARNSDNRSLLSQNYWPNPVEEPQIVFRRDAAESFDERYCYGRRPKVELLWRLGVAGPWDTFPIEDFDLPKPAPSGDAGKFGRAGWVARLESGRPELETAGKGRQHRGRARDEAVIAFLDRLDLLFAEKHLDRKALRFYDDAKLEAASQGRFPEIAQHLADRAAECRRRGPNSVLNKTTLPPSGDAHDYWHPAPFWWPNPDTADGLPYVRRDGHRVPGTELHGPGSEQFDRSSLQRVFDDTTILALAWRVHGDERCVQHAAALIRTWFIDPETRMNPHLRYAQVRRGHNNDEGRSTGLIEMKDLYYFLDAARIVFDAGALSPEARTSFEAWLTDYATWLMHSEAGVSASRRRNNHGTMYDLQVASIAAFLGNPAALVSTVRRAHRRAIAQFDADGAQSEEVTRSQARHYSTFNLQGWANLARVLGGCGYDLWTYGTNGGPVLRRGLGRLFNALASGKWPDTGDDDIDLQRLHPLVSDYRRRYDPSFEPRGLVDTGVLAPPVFGPEYAIAPYWMFARD